MIERPANLPSRTFTHAFECGDDPTQLRSTKFYIHIQHHPVTLEIIEVMFDVGKCGCCHGILFSLLAQTLSYTLRSNPSLIKRIIGSCSEVACGAKVAGAPASCIDWVSLCLVEVEVELVACRREVLYSGWLSIRRIMGSLFGNRYGS